MYNIILIFFQCYHNNRIIVCISTRVHDWSVWMFCSYVFAKIAAIRYPAIAVWAWEWLQAKMISQVALQGKLSRERFVTDRAIEGPDAVVSSKKLK